MRVLCWGVLCGWWGEKSDMSEGGMSCYLVGGCVHEEGGGLLVGGGGI